MKLLKDEGTVMLMNEKETKLLKEALKILIELEHNAASEVSDEAEYHYFAEDLANKL